MPRFTADHPENEPNQLARERRPNGLTPADAVISGLTGWLFICVGCAAIAAATLIPTYIDTIGLQESRATQAIKAEALSNERQRYEDFYRALLDNDPILIERLAISELRLKPVGTQIAERLPRDPLALVTEPTDRAMKDALARQPLTYSIENELSRPDLKLDEPEQVEFDRPRQTRLIVAATGEHRPLVAGFGALLVMLGLWPRRALHR